VNIVAFPNPGEKAMPAKQTREAIEAELNASERERIALQLRKWPGTSIL
jgi:hypothetical protein